MKRQANESGFTLLQLVVVLAIISVASTFAVLGVRSARASMRLSNSTRQFGAYVERARADAVRRHGSTTVQMLSTSTYSVTMDFGAGASVTTQTFPLESGVTFITTLQSITFDWRGRIPSEISVGFSNESGTANVNITGSGDVTIDSEIFHDTSVPHLTYNNNVSGDVVADPTPTPGGSSSASPSPSASPSASATPTPTPEPTATPKHDNGNGNGNGNGGSPTPTPTPTPTPSPTPTPTPSPTPTPCTLIATPSELTVVQNGSASIVVTRSSSSGSTTVTAESSNSGQLQVSPASATLTDNTGAMFTVTVKKQSGSVTFSSSCGSKTVNVTVQ